MDLFQYEQLCEMNESELTVYNYVSTHMEKIAQMSIRELSAAAGVSTTTILRFCSKLGCEGYKEFKHQLQKTLSGQKSQHIYFPSTIYAIQFLQKAAKKPGVGRETEKNC